MVLPVPGCCIWCREPAPPSDRERTDRSHVLHQCLGNADEQVLPPGVVCRPCNGYFGVKLDPALLEFPPLLTNAALLEVINLRGKKLFRDFVPGVGRIPDTPSEVIEVSIGVAPAKLVLDLRRPIVGRYEVPYSPKRLRVLSRAVHKLLVESIAWQVYVHGHAEPVDLFDSAFDPVRRWVRRGEPHQGAARPWLWQLPPEQDLLQGWRVEPLYLVRGRGFARMRVFGNWFFADVTSENRDVLSSLSESKPAPDIFRIADSIAPSRGWGSLGPNPLPSAKNQPGHEDKS